MRYSISHRTTYHYPEPVSQCYSLAHLLPRQTSYQRCLSASLQIWPLPVMSVLREDYFGNQTNAFTIQLEHQTLVVEAQSQVEIVAEIPNLSLDFGLSCADVLAQMKGVQTEETLIAREYVLPSPMVFVSDTLAEYARPSFDANRPFFSAVSELTRRIYQDFTYDPKFSSVSTPLSEVLEHRRGVCQDFAHLAIGCLRSLGYAARYVSGYLETLPPPGQAKLQGADASHAWFATYSPREGWCDFDPTNNLLVSTQHITTAWGRDFSDVTPLKGTLIGGGLDHQLIVEVDVERLN